MWKYAKLWAFGILKANVSYSFNNVFQFIELQYKWLYNFLLLILEIIEYMYDVHIFHKLNNVKDNLRMPFKWLGISTSIENRI